MKRRANPFPGVTTAPDRHGRLRHRLRRTVKGRKVDCYLPGAYGSSEFRTAYEAAIEGARTVAIRAQPGTVGFLIEAYLASSKFSDLAQRTRATKRGRLDWIRTAIGKGRIDHLEPRHIEALMAKKGGPEAANRLKKDLSQLFRFAAKRYGYKGQNPAKLADSRKTRKGGFHTWSDDEIAAFRKAFASGSKPRLALEVLLGTGAARQDAAALTRANIRGDRLSYRRGKTGQEVDLPIVPDLARELSHVPHDQMLLLAHSDGSKGYTPESFGNWFRRQCQTAGLPHCSPHGLRKAGARRLAEHGATEFEVMAFLAHGTAKEASRYVSAANRAKLTSSGMARLGTIEEQNLSNLHKRLDKGGV